jgi:hypothetical protein
MKKARFIKHLTISTSDEQYNLIKQITDEQCISMSEWTRGVLRAALIKNQHKEKITNDE